MTDTKTISTGVPVPSTTLVQTDHSTIIGDGSHQHPLTAIGGGGGIVIEDEGSPIAGNPHGTVNFVGPGVVATNVGSVATITVPGGPALSSANPATISDATDDPGAATDVSRSDHLHAHGDRGGGSLHSLFTSIAPGFTSLNVVTPPPARTLDSVFQPSATRPTLCIYSVDITCTLNGGVGAAGSIQLLSDSVNPPTTIRCEFFLDTGGNLGAGEEVTNVVESLLIYLVPQGDFVSLTTVPSAGGPTFAFDFATEINL